MSNFLDSCNVSLCTYSPWFVCLCTVLDVKDFDTVTSWCRDNSVDLVVVGPEDPLAAGIADHLTQQGSNCLY